MILYRETYYDFFTMYILYSSCKSPVSIEVCDAKSERIGNKCDKTKHIDGSKQRRLYKVATYKIVEKIVMES